MDEKNNLGRILKVDLRKAWNHEALDFTRWLAKPENISLLSDEIGIEIKTLQTEAQVGSFSLDILAEEENTGRKIIIENQLEATNHDHLGKIITYASGFDAEIVIWIVKEVREEHKQAIDWLNEHTDENINFFAIKMELWQIGNSPFAPKFQVISQPNNWAKAIKSSTKSGVLTETKIQQLDFWTRFKDYVRSVNPNFRLQTPRPQHWFDVSMGSSDAHIALTVNSREELIGCEVYINNNKELFNFLREQRNKIETEIEGKAEWVDAPIASRIKIKKEVSGLFDLSISNDYSKWLFDKTTLFQKVFGKYIKEFNKK